MKHALLLLSLLVCLFILGAAAQAHGHNHDDDDDHHGHDHSHSHSHSHAPAPSSSNYETPQPASSVFFEPFDASWTNRWTLISSSKYNGRFTVAEPKKNAGIAGDKGLLVPEKARHYAAVAKFPSVLDPSDKDLVIQYEVRLQDGLDCGGAYLKILTADTLGSLDSFSNETPYTIMFGPDKCGTSSKVHFIFRHQNPVSKEFEEKHMKNPPAIKNDKLTHLYTLHVRPDNTFAVYIDLESVVSGSLLEDFEPAVNPPKEIDDATDKKPSDWVDEATIPDPDAKKPDDWDENAPANILDMEAVKPDDWLDNEPATIPDPTARKPNDWSDEEDGEWVAPLIPNPACEDVGCGKWERPNKPNPAYKGKWRAPQIANAKYKGPWAPRKIPNPNYFEDNQPAKFRPIAAVGIEIWTMSEGLLFDNILITTDKSAADKFAKATFVVKRDVEKANDVPDTPDTDESSSKTFLEQLQDALAEFRKRLDDPYVLGATIAAAAIPLLIVFLWRSKPAAPTAPAASSPAASRAAAPVSTESEKKDESGTPKKNRKKGEQ